MVALNGARIGAVAGMAGLSRIRFVMAALFSTS